MQNYKYYIIVILIFLFIMMSPGSKTKYIQYEEEEFDEQTDQTNNEDEEVDEQPDQTNKEEDEDKLGEETYQKDTENSTNHFGDIIFLIVLIVLFVFIILFVYNQNRKANSYKIIPIDQNDDDKKLKDPYDNKGLKKKYFQKLQIDAYQTIKYTNEFAFRTQNDSFEWFTKKMEPESITNFFQPYLSYQITKKIGDRQIKIYHENIFKGVFVESNDNDDNKLKNFEEVLGISKDENQTVSNIYNFPETLEYLFFDPRATAYTYNPLNEITINEKYSFGLFAILLGGTGHYIALIQQHDGWWKHDDGKVTKINNIYLYEFNLPFRAYVYVKNLEGKLGTIAKNANLETPGNLGNTCYMYSMLKILLFLPDFQSKVKQYLTRKYQSLGKPMKVNDEDDYWFIYYLRLYELYFPKKNKYKKLTRK